MNTKSLTKLGACDEAVKWAATQPDFATAWTACERGDWLLWIAARLKVERKLIVLAACVCARLALKYVPAGEERPLLAIGTAEAWCRDEATIEEVRAAAADADAAADAAAAADAYAAADAAAYAAAAAAADADAAAAAAADADAYAAAAADAYAAADAAAYAAAAAAAAAYAAADADAAAYAAAYAAADAAADAARIQMRKDCAEAVRGQIPLDVVVALWGGVNQDA